LAVHPAVFCSFIRSLISFGLECVLPRIFFFRLFCATSLLPSLTCQSPQEHLSSCVPLLARSATPVDLYIILIRRFFSYFPPPTVLQTSLGLLSLFAIDWTRVPHGPLVFLTLKNLFPKIFATNRGGPAPPFFQPNFYAPVPNGRYSTSQASFSLSNTVPFPEKCAWLWPPPFSAYHPPPVFASVSPMYSSPYPLSFAPASFARRALSL